MSEKRRDAKGRLLRNGESQRKDGKYEYKYTDAQGERRSVYSWKLVESDKAPAGKRCSESLREMEATLLRDLVDGINSYKAINTTLNAYYDEYIETKHELKQSTRTNYRYMYGKYVHDTLGYRPIAKIKYSDIRRFYLSLIHDKGFKPNSMEIIHTILHPVFAMAVRDELIRVNPTDGIMAEIKKSHAWEKPKRHALTESQQKAFVDFVAASSTYKHWLPLFTVLLGTGGRIGEILGLCWEDCDFENRLISINHNLICRVQDNGKCEYHITTPKTKTGIREIPMLEDVYQALLTEQARQKNIMMERPNIDGYRNFVFLNRFNDVQAPHAVNRAIARIRRDYNLAEEVAARTERRLPLLLPHFSAHNLRHTFCTRFCENETNLKVIQEIMGHADITTTMDIYNEATLDKKIESFANLEGKLKIS